ncbi:MAG TPA: ABC transporter permease [Dehalococcoidia bacterium]|nr:ABC transporter permease [Dehalococcoidia bacterium]
MHIDPKQEVVKSKGGRLGLTLLLVVVLMAIFADLLTPYDPLAQTAQSFESPSWEHLLGTNHVGQDIWSQLVYGARTSLVVGLLVAALSTVLAALIGASTALIGGVYDRIVMRLVDAFIIIPMILLLILLSIYVDPNLGSGAIIAIEVLIGIIVVGIAFYMVRSLGWVGLLIIGPVLALIVLARNLLPTTGGLIIILSLLSWQGGARTLRAQALALKEKPHVAAARGFGANTWYIIRRHIIPDMGPLLVADFVFCVRRAVFLQAGMAFLGIGNPNVVSWGSMINDARQWIFLDAWRWWLVPAGVALSITIVAITLIGSALEPALDPRLRGEVSAQN